LLAGGETFKDTLDIYEKLWNDATSAFARGEPQIDSHLSHKPTDLRRGVTIVFRPSLSVRDKVMEYLDQLATFWPEQYFYRPEELHVTVMSIISGTEFWRREIRQLVACRAIIGDVLRRQQPFQVSFRGVTASPGSVIIQGFPLDDGLARIRDGLREAFEHTGLCSLLDRRYKISTAHMTAMRFSQPDADWKHLAALLEDGRQTNFGEMEVNRLQLIWGDWYASANIVRTLEEYRLGAYDRVA
jgi:2'-5' RNA ligase